MTTVVPLGAVTFRVDLTAEEVPETLTDPLAYLRALAEQHIVPALRERGITEELDLAHIVSACSIRAWTPTARPGSRAIRVTFPHPDGPEKPEEINPLNGMHVRLADGPLAGSSTIVALSDHDCIHVHYTPGHETWEALLAAPNTPVPDETLVYCRTGYDVAAGQWIYTLEEKP